MKINRYKKIIIVKDGGYVECRLFFEFFNDVYDSFNDFDDSWYDVYVYDFFLKGKCI